MTRVKICGLTLAADVRRAAALGVWACGFVLTASPRRVSPAEAATLAPAAGGALTVGVFTTESAEEVAAALAAAGLGAVQLSAGADGPGVAAVRAAAVRRGLRPRVIAAADTPDAALADWLLLDARVAGLYGGTGRTADWTDAARLAAGGRLLLAGGLHPGNAGAAVIAARPFAVDVSGGVERGPGIKDHELMRLFVAAVAAADAKEGRAP